MRAGSRRPVGRATHSRYEGQIHAFFVLTDRFDAAFAAHDEAAAALKKAFASAS